MCLIPTSLSSLKKVGEGMEGEVGCVFAFILFAVFKAGPPTARYNQGPTQSVTEGQITVETSNPACAGFPGRYA